MQSSVPRILVCAPASGGGKTTFACGLLQAFSEMGLHPSAAKCGPDYIDPMFHRTAIGSTSCNLDLFFSSENDVRRLLAETSEDSGITLIEGVMGYYDGIAVSEEASSWDLARATDTPAILVVDGRGRARSIAAEIIGFMRYRDPSMIAGVVLNRISSMLCSRLAPMIEKECGVRVFGCIPVLEDCSLESRHLGLVTADEVDDLKEKLHVLAQAIIENVDVEGIVDLARSAPALEYEPREHVRIDGSPRIAVARDDAFCFYYEESLRLLRELGAELVEFSLLKDESLPDGTQALYIGGGYPELHALELSANQAMRDAVADAIAAGIPVVAECGGFMYLHESLQDPTGKSWPMAGVIPGESYKTDRLSRFGYIDITAKQDGLLADAGDVMRAHEFHYWNSENPGSAFHAQKPQSNRAWDCVVSGKNIYAGYPHLYLYSDPQAARRFVEAARCFAHKAKGREVGEL